MRLAFSTLACPGWSIAQVAAAARTYGYDGVEIRLIDGRLFDSSLPHADRRRVRETFEEAGLPIVAVDTSVRVAADPEPAKSIAELEAMVQLASEWSASVVRVFGGEWGPDRTREQAVGQARYVLGEAAAAAQPLGVSLALETHDRFSSVELVAEVLEGLPACAAAVWDVGHPYRAGDDAYRVLRLLAGRVVHVHVKDARRAGPDSNEWQLTLLGEGEVPVRSSLDALDASGYAGWISVEWEKHWHPELAEPEIALPQFAAVLRSWSRER